MDYTRLLNYIMDNLNFSDENIFAEVTYLRDCIIIANKKNKKTMWITVRDHGISCDDYLAGENYYEPNFQGANECIKQILSSIKFGFDIYGFNETRKRIYRSCYYDETKDESIMVQMCEEAVKKNRGIKYISASNFAGDKVLKFCVQNEKLIEVD